MIRFERPPPGATAEERASVYADALVATETALNAFKDDLSQATEEILVLRNLLEKDREEFRQFREERKRDREADKTRRQTEKQDRQAEKDSFERRFEHLEEMLERVLRKLSIEAPTVPEMRDRAPSVHDVEDAVERSMERMVRKTPTTAFQVPTMPGMTGWGAPGNPMPITRSDVKELVENKVVRDERDDLRDAAVRRADMYRNIIVGIAGLVGAGGVVWIVVQIIRVAAAGH